MTAAEPLHYWNRDLSQSERDLDRVDSSSFESQDVQVVVGSIEIDTLTVSGGLLAACLSDRYPSDCCLRRVSERVIEIAQSEHCKWCKSESNTRHRRDTARQHFGNGSWLRDLFQLTLVQADRLCELLTELINTQDTREETRSSFPITVTPPYCAVEDVTHISRAALTRLLTFDPEFLWGDNLIFNTKSG